MSTTCTDCRVRKLGISPRDVQLLEHVAQGYANKEIARLVGISGRTVKNRLSLVNVALGTETRTQAVLIAHALGLLDLPKLARQCARRLGHRA